MIIHNSKRKGFSWDPEFKTAVQDLKIFLKTKEEGGDPTNLEIFMLCMAVGFDGGLKRDVPPRKTDSARLEVLTEREFAIMRALALHELKDSSKLLDDDVTFDIAEQYAAAGLMLLSQEMSATKDFRGSLTARLYKAVKSVRSSLDVI